MTGIFLVATLTLATSFLCSLLEAVLYSITPSQLEVIRKLGTPAGDRLVRLRADIEAPIAAILTVNTIAHTVGAAWCGAMVAAEFGDAALGVFAAVFTVLVLALTEIVPKSLGVRYAGTLGTLIVWPLTIMTVVVWPIVWTAQKSMRLFIGPARPLGPSEEEVVLFAHLAAQKGALRPEERDWVRNALNLDKVTAADLRTPRTVLVMVGADTRVGDLAERASLWPYSRVPVIEGGDADQVIGLVHRRAVLTAAVAGQNDLTMRELTRHLTLVPTTKPAHELLRHFLDQRCHMVGVLDEYGGFDGVVTLEDVLECLLGREIVDEYDEVEDLQQHARERSPLARQGGTGDGETGHDGEEPAAGD